MPGPESERKSEKSKRRWVRRIWDEARDFTTSWFERQFGPRRPELEDDDEDDETDKPRRSLWRRFLGLPVKNTVTREEVPFATSASIEGSRPEQAEHVSRADQAENQQAGEGISAEELEAAGDSAERMPDETEDFAGYAASIEREEQADTLPERESDEESVELPPPVPYAAGATKRPIPEPIIHLRERGEADALDPDPIFERTPHTGAERSDPEARYVRNRRAEHLAAGALVGAIGVDLLSRGRDRAIRQEQKVQKQEIKEHAKVLERLEANQRKDVVAPIRSSEQPPVYPGRSNAYKAESMIVPRQAASEIRDTPSGNRVEVAARPVPAPEVVVRNSERQHVPEEAQYIGRRPEEVLVQVEEAAEKNEPLEGAYERRAEVRDQRDGSAKDKAAAFLEGSRGGQDTSGAYGSGYFAHEDQKKGLMQSVQQKLQGNDQYKTAVVSGLWGALIILVLVAVLVATR